MSAVSVCISPLPTPMTATLQVDPGQFKKG
jgi:hypothetical protein